MDVLLLAGGKCSPELEKVAGTPYRSMIPIHGRPIIEIVLDAVRFLGDPIVVGGPDGISPRQTEAGETFIESLKSGLSLATTEKILLITSDLPFIHEEAIRDFLKRCKENASIHYSIIKIPGKEETPVTLKRTTLKIKEGKFTGGNVVLAAKQSLQQSIHVLEKGYLLRKNPLKLAKMIGITPLFRAIIGQVFPATLPLKYLEKATSRLLNATMKGVVTPHTEIGNDIDSQEQYLAVIKQNNL